MWAEYSDRGFTYEIKHYITRLPSVCKKLQSVRLHAEKAESEKLMQQMFTDTFKLLMFNEYEIIHFLKYLKNFPLEDNGFFATISFIALATKMLLNDEKVKDPIVVFLNHNNPSAYFHFNYWITKNNHLMKN